MCVRKGYQLDQGWEELTTQENNESSSLIEPDKMKMERGYDYFLQTCLRRRGRWNLLKLEDSFGTPKKKV